MSLNHSLITAENGQQFITVFANGVMTPPVDDSHPNFKAIVGACAAAMQGEDIDAQAVIDLFDVGATVQRKFERLSERVTVEYGQVMFDGDPAPEGLSKQIVRFMDEGEDFAPLVRFMENMGMNPNEHSRQQAWDWLNNHDFTLTAAGDVVAYKGVYNDDKGGYRSGHRGNAFVNDVAITDDYVPNAVGDIITMPRSEVAHDPSQACHRGLHVGTYNYARSYARGAMLRVIVSPRDFVSVPTDAEGEKFRVCRYVVDAIIDAPDTGALLGERFEDDDNRDLDVDLKFMPGDFVRDPHEIMCVIESFDPLDQVYLVSYDEDGDYGAWNEDQLTRA
jgi:hypothetical protein